MTTIENQLAPGEKLIFFTRRHPLVFLIPILFNLISLILITGITSYTNRHWIFLFYIIPFTVFISELLSWHRRLYLLTNKSLITKEGIFRISTINIPLETIQNISCSQSIPGKIFRYGSVGIETSMRQDIVLFHFLAKPSEFRNRILFQQESSEKDSVSES